MTDGRPKTVWILGAGANKSLGAPLLWDLFTPTSADVVNKLYPGIFGGRWDPGQVVRVYQAGRGPEGSNNAAFRLQAPAWKHAEEFLEHLDRAHPLHGTPPEMAAQKRVNAAIEASVSDGREGDLDEARPTLRDRALKLFAAEVSVFLHHTVDMGSERFKPYAKWAKGLSRHDTVLTFNYDLLVDKLAAETGNLVVWNPSGEQSGRASTVAQVLKLHGSLNWRKHEDRISVVHPDGSPARNEQGDPTGTLDTTTAPFAMKAPVDQLAIAVPGPSKRAFTESGLMSPLWRLAEERITAAERVVFVGYRFPETDSISRERLLAALGSNKQNAAVEIVLGPFEDVHVARLRGLIESVTDCNIYVHRLWAEDFFALRPHKLPKGHVRTKPAG